MKNWLAFALLSTLSFVGAVPVGDTATSRAVGDRETYDSDESITSSEYAAIMNHVVGAPTHQAAHVAARSSRSVESQPSLSASDSLDTDAFVSRFYPDIRPAAPFRSFHDTKPPVPARFRGKATSTAKSTSFPPVIADVPPLFHAAPATRLPSIIATTQPNVHPCLLSFPRNPPPMMRNGAVLEPLRKDVLFQRLSSTDRSSIRNRDQIFYESPYTVCPKSGEFFEGSQILFRFRVMALLGRGTFGDVFSAFDYASNKEVALKIFKQNDEETSHEIRMVQRISQRTEDKLFFVRAISVLHYRDLVFVVMPLYEMDLYQFKKSHGGAFKDLRVIRQIAKELLAGLYQLHARGVIHNDLKPQNILVASEEPLSVVISDFSNSVAPPTPRGEPYRHVTRWYEAPEITLEIHQSAQSDMWSFAVTLAELYSGQPLFPCKEGKMLTGIYSLLQTVPPYRVDYRHLEVKNLQSALLNQLTARSASDFKFRSWNQVIPPYDDVNSRHEYDLFVKFLKSILLWNPLQRPTTVQAFHHEFMTYSAPEPSRKG